MECTDETQGGIVNNWKRTLILWLGAVMVLGAGWPMCAVTTRLIDVDLEVFRPWGVLGLGTWQTMGLDFVSMRIEGFPEVAREGLGSIAEQCASNRGLDEGACSAIAELEYVFHRSYSTDPVLGSEYRVVMTNRTETLLGVVLGIDGLNTNGSEELVGTDADKKWILLPHQTVRIAGWQVSEDEALAFRFATPSATHSLMDSARGQIQLGIYLADPMAFEYVKGTEAGQIVDQPTVRIPFESATATPVETLQVSYAREHVTLGILCENTDGTGIRIREVVAGTIAELKGLREGDLITYVNAVPMHSCEDLRAYLETRSPGDRVVAKVHREGRAFLLTLELEE